MKRGSWYGYEVEIDEEATRDWYAQAEAWDCGCGHCRNFLALARERRLPAEVLGLLDGLGIPPEKATFVCAYYTEKEKGLDYQFSWRMAGRILSPEIGMERMGPGIRFPWGKMEIGHEKYPYGAPGFPEPHFDLECFMFLPWVLDEPLEGTE